MRKLNCIHFLAILAATGSSFLAAGQAAAGPGCSSLSVTWTVTGVANLTEDKSQFDPVYCIYKFVGDAPAGGPISVTVEMPLQKDQGASLGIKQTINGGLERSPANVVKYVTCWESEPGPAPECSAGALRVSATYRNVQADPWDWNLNRFQGEIDIYGSTDIKNDDDTYQPFSINIVARDRSATPPAGTLGGPTANLGAATAGSGGQGILVCQGAPSYWVNAASLNLVVHDTDFRYQGLGPGVVLTRSYNLDPGHKGLFGNGWSSTYEARITQAGGLTGSATLATASGQALTYTKPKSTTAGGTQTTVYTPPTGTFDTLTAYTTGSVAHYLYREKDTKNVHRFDADPTLASSFRLSSITDRNGNALTLAYNADGTPASLTDAAGRKTSFAYSAQKLCIKATTPDGESVTSSYDAAGNLTGTIDLAGTAVSYTYDAGGFMTSMTAGGRTVGFTYDNSGGWRHVATVTDADGYVTRYAGVTSTRTTATDALQHTTTYNSGGGRTASVVDARGNTWSMTYTNGLPVSSTDPNGNVSSFAWDSRGNLSQSTDPTGAVTRLAYDGDDNLLTVTDATNEVWRFAYDGRGNLTAMTSPSGKKRTLTYDARGNVLSVVDGNLKTTNFAYDPNQFFALATVTDAVGKATSFGYDAAAINLTAITDPNSYTTRFDYDRNRRLTRTSYPDGSFRSFGYDALALTSLTDEAGKATLLTRDNRLNVVKLADPSGREFKSSVDGAGNLAWITDSLGHTRSYLYDAADQLAETVDPASNVVDVLRDGNGNVTALTDERGKATGIAYNRLDRIAAVTDPLGRRVTTGYDALGRPSLVTNARGATIGFAYDSDGRLSGKSYSGTNFASYTYDGAGNLLTVSDTTGETTYSYDAANRVTGITYQDGKAVSLTYEGNGNLQTLSYPGGLLVTYSYDNRDWVRKVAWGGNVIDFGYAATGNLISETRSNGTQSAYAYDASSLLTSVAHHRGGSTIAELAYSRDAAGRITAETGVFPMVPALVEGSATGAYDAADGVTTWNGDRYTYDADGNPTAITGNRTFSATYDNENRPTAMTIDGNTATYVYDGLGRRAKAQTSAATRNFHHDPWGRLLFETDAGGQVTATYVHAAGRIVASRSNGSFVFYHSDKTGNTLALTDSAGTVVGAFAYSPFGELLGSTGTATTPFKFVGAFGVMDEGNGIYFMRNRYYDANASRFLQKDPLGFAGQQSNLYAYVGNDPVRFFDPYGRELGWQWGMAMTNAVTGLFTGIVAGIGGVAVVTSTLAAVPAVVAGGTVLAVGAFAVGRLVEGKAQLDAHNEGRQTFDPNDTCQMIAASPLGPIPFINAAANAREGKWKAATKAAALDVGKFVAGQAGKTLIGTPGLPQAVSNTFKSLP